MPTTRALLAQRSRDELLTALDAYELDASDSGGTDCLVDVLVASTDVDIAEILGALPRTRLKSARRDHGLFAWVEHMVHDLAPTGVPDFVLATGAMSSGDAHRTNISDGDYW